MSTRPLRAAVWGAVSSKKQNAPGTISLDLQISLGQAVAAENKWPVVAVLKMAHSRNYTDLELWKRDLKKSGNDAGEMLFSLWKARAFDVLIVHTLDRLGSKMSMITRVIEETVLMGAIIYVIQDKITLDRDNYPLISAFGSYFTTTRMRKILEVRDAQMKIRAPLGNPAGRGNLRLAHTVKRGKQRFEDRVVVDESQRNVWLDAAHLFVDQRIGTVSIEDELYRQFGHVNPVTGKPYGPSTYYNMLHTPTFWGHTSIGLEKAKSGQAEIESADMRHMSKRAWVYDVNEMPPPGLRVFRNTHAPVYTGELAERVIGELRRRHSVRGRAKPNATHALSGLLICEHCHTRLTPLLQPKRKTKTKLAMGIAVEGRSADDYYLYWICPSAYKLSRSRYEFYGRSQDCPCRALVTDNVLKEQITDLLKCLKAQSDLSTFVRHDDSRSAVDPDVVNNEIAVIRDQMRRVIDLQIAMGADDVIQQQYAERLKELSERLAIKNDVLNNILTAGALDQTDSAQQVLTRLQNFDVQAMWTLPSAAVNQELHIRLAEWRFLVDVPEKLIVGLGVP